MENQTAKTPTQPTQGSKENRDSLTHKVGDAIERVGEKIADAGAGKIGRVVSDLGDKLEHAGEAKPAKPSTSNH